MKNTDDLTINKFMPALFLTILVFIGLVLLGDIRQVGTLVSAFDWRYFALAIVFTLFNYVLRFFKWHYYIRLLGVANLSLYESAKLFVGGFPLAVTPGKIGEVLKALWLNQKSGLPLPQGVSVVVAERLSDGLAVLGLSTLGVISFPEYWLVFISVLLLLVSLVVVSQVKPLAFWILDRMAALPVLKKISSPAREFYEGSNFLFKPRALVIAVGIGLVSWLGEGIGFYFILQGLGLPPGSHLAALAVFVLSFSTIVGAVSTLPGGLGAIEASIAGMLTLLGGVASPVAATATLLVRLATLWFGVLLGLLVWLIAPELIGLRRSHGRPD
ncbi:MAG: flippase-like domain-containing protein [Anaerolineae bacterium]|nr:flippase-like domain-containing protein [Anaerolineae bacterium]